MGKSPGLLIILVLSLTRLIRNILPMRNRMHVNEECVPCTCSGHFDMEGGSFYSRGSTLSRPQAVGLGYLPVQPYSYDGVLLHSGGSVDSCFSDVGLGQKIDQMVHVIHEQAKETALELCSLRADMKELQDTNKVLSESVSSSSSSTPPAVQRKILTELSVRQALLVCLH